MGPSSLQALKAELTHGSIPALRVGVGINNGGIAALKIVLAGRDDIHSLRRLETDVAGAFTVRGRSLATVAVGAGQAPSGSLPIEAAMATCVEHGVLGWCRCLAHLDYCD